jgi:hypothetical protein
MPGRAPIHSLKPPARDASAPTLRVAVRRVGAADSGVRSGAHRKHPEAPERAPRAALLVVLLCCLATLVVKWIVNLPRSSVSHGDVAFYYTVAKNLVSGSGFTIDYIWNFWDHPQGIPTPSNTWWMPLPSVICALGMAIFGVGYATAQATMIVVTSVMPLLLWLLGRELFRDWRVGLLGALLGTTFHLFMDQPSAPLSHGPYLVTATLSLWLIVRSVRDPRCLPWAGAAIALTQLSRSDGILLVLPLVATHVAHRSWPGWRRAALVLAGYALVMSPWWAHNLVTMGSPGPSGAFRAAFLRGYEQWYSLPESVTPATWLQDGVAPALELKRIVSVLNAETAATGLVSGAAEREGAWDHAAVVALLVLAWIGAATTLRRRFVPAWTQLAAEWAFYSLVFTAVGLESFRTGMYSVYPVLLLCAAAGLLLLARGAVALLPARWPRERVRLALALGVTAWIVGGQYAFARDSLERKGASIQRLGNFYRVLDQRVLEYRGLKREVIMARDVHELHAFTGVRCVQIPNEPEHVIRDVARQFGVTYLLLLGAPGERSTRPALERTIERNPHYALVEGPSCLYGITFRLYRLLDAQPGSTAPSRRNGLGSAVKDTLITAGTTR